MNLKKITLFFTACISCKVSAVWLDSYKPQKQIQTSRVNNHAWNQWLKKYVTQKGFVYYTRGKKDIALLQNYTRYLRSIDIKHLKKKNQRLAFYINLYNAMTVWGVYQYTNIQSVMSKKHFFDAKFYLGSRIISLNYLENQIIRPRFQEPLVHFALNCASYSCPPLYNQAYEAANLKKTLLRQAKKYMSDKRFVYVDHQKKEFVLIELFRWYKNDFKNLFAFYKKITGTSRDLSGYQIRFIPYSWKLNGK